MNLATRDWSTVYPTLWMLARTLFRTIFPKKRTHFYNTSVNEIGMLEFAGDATPFDPSPKYSYGFKGVDESVDTIIADDAKTLGELGVTYEQLADLIERIFATGNDYFWEWKIMRWEHVHSPICPWNDFCTKSYFDHTPQVMEIWLCHPDHVREIQKWYASFNTNGYPIEDLKGFVDKGWVIALSDLHPHLIREHHFFEGHGTPYRVDPRKLAELL